MPEKEKRIPRLRYLLGGFFTIVIFLVAFYQPILFGIVQLVAQQVAKSQALSLQFKIHGSLFTNLEIEDLHLRPLPENTKLPLERIDAKRIGARYNLLSLLKKDFRSLVELLELKDVDVVIRPSSEPPPQQKLEGPPRMPAVIPEKVDIQDVNLIVRSEAGDLEVRKFALAFQQGQAGYLACEELRIPVVGAWKQLRAGLSYNQDKLVLTDLALDPVAAVHLLQLDLSGLEEGRIRLVLDAKALESSIAASASYEQPADVLLVNATLKVTGLELGQIQKLAPVSISGTVPEIDVELGGELSHPNSLSGSITVAANKVRYQNYVIDGAKVALTIDEGRGKIQESVDAGPNKIRANGNFTLSNTLDELLSKSSADVGFAAEVPDPNRYIPGLTAATLVTGSVGLANGRIQSIFQVSAAGIGMPKLLPGLAVSAANAEVFAVAQLPLAQDLWTSLAGVVLGNVANISYQEGRLRQVHLAADAMDSKRANVDVTVSAGESRAAISANMPLPTSDAPFDARNVAGRLTFNISSISDFVGQNLVEGSFTADGDVRFDRLQANGVVRAKGRELTCRGMNLQTLDLNAVLRNEEANIQDFRINFDPDNYVQLTGSTKLNDPFPFQASGKVNLKNAAVLNEFFRNLGAEPGLSGAINVNFSGAGDIHNPSAQLRLSGDQLRYRGFLLQSVDLETNVEHSKADIERCRITLDPNNYVDITGSAQLTDPYPYQARGRIELRDLSLFNTLLKGLGQREGLSGAFHANFSGSGDNRSPAARLEVQGEQLKYRGLPIRNVNVEANIGGSKAEIETCRVMLDANNHIDLTGTAQLADPYPYVVNGAIVLSDLAVFKELLQDLGQPVGLSGALNGTFSSHGDTKNPAAELQLSGNQLKYRDLLVQSADVKARVEEAKATIQTCRITLDQNNFIDVTGEAGLPDPHPYEARGAIGFRDLKVFNNLLKSLGQPGGLSGALNLNFSGRGDAKEPTAQLQVSGDELKYRGLVVRNVDLKSTVEKSTATIETGRVTLDADNYIDMTGRARIDEPYSYEARGAIALKNLGAFNDLLQSFGQTAGLAGTFNVELSGKGNIKNPAATLHILGNQLKYRGLLIQTVDLESEMQNFFAKIQNCRITLDANNYIDLTGETGLSDPYVYKTTGTIEFKDLGILSELLKSTGQSAPMSGNIHIDWSGKGDLESGIPDANLHVLANQIKYRGLLVQKIDITGDLVQRKLNLPSCNVVFDQSNFIDARGNALLDEPYNYDADATIQFQDLGFFNELVKSFGQDLGLGGKLNATWRGKGPLKDQTGNVELHADQLRTKAVQRIKVDVTGSYQGMNAEVPRLQISSPYADLDASIRFNPQLFEIPALNIRKSANAITGNVKIPLNLQGGGKVPLDLDQPVEVNIAGDKISLAPFQTDKPQVTGMIGFQLQASKTLRDPLVQLTATARDIRSTAISSLSAAQGDLSVRLADKVLTVDGKIQQPDIHPLLLTGRVPLDLGQIIETGSVPDNTALQFALKWPDNNLAFIRKIVPDVKIVEGTTNVDVNVNGTIKHPDLSGEIRANLSRFQAKTDTVPPISNFSTTITFRRDRVQIDQLKGLAGGGLFGVSGAVDLKDGTNPKLDIKVTGRQVLLTRSDGIIVRANFNLAIRGPLSAGEVSGTVGISDSRFFKDIDILPLNLPGRPPPQPPAGAPPKIAVDTPPFKDWKFNIGVRTDDAFLIQSNLARGSVTINLQVGGNGAAPTVTGFVRVDRLVASLPFSKMEIDNGMIDFVPGANILDPGLSIIGRSTVRDYEVRARIFGNVSNPTVLLDSSPPLAQGDILVLLATGSTTSEFAQDPSLLAGRATFIVLQQVFGRFFPSRNRAGEQKEPFIDRFGVTIIPGRKAGEQEISTTFKLTKNWEIIGDFGTGSYQGRLKYLVRFR